MKDWCWSSSAPCTLRSASNGNFGRLADAFMTLATATSIEEFGKGVDQIPVNLNLFYADATHIGYWHAGDIPIEPKGVNQFLPRSGEGDAEWQGFVPRSELLALVVALVATGTLAALLVRSTPQVTVLGGSLQAGRAQLPLEFSGAVEPLDAVGMRHAHGPGLDARA